MTEYEKLVPPKRGKKITVKNGKWTVPDNPIVCWIEGDGIGPEISSVMRKVVDAAVEKAYKGKRKIEWFEIYAGNKARALYNPKVTDEQLKALSPQDQRKAYLPDDTLKAVREYHVAIKGPCETPVGKGFSSINVGLRQFLSLGVCLRPVWHIKGVPAPVNDPDAIDMVVFRENLEDIYAGIEAYPGSEQAKQIINFLRTEWKVPVDSESLRDSSGISIKPMSPENSKNLVRSAIEYAIKMKRHVVTICHKGNIMKATEGQFMNWGYEVAKEEFRNVIVTEEELNQKYGGDVKKAIADGKILVNDRIQDAMFQQVLLRPMEYEVLAMPNLNGDYLSDQLAAQVGGLGFAPGANLNDNIFFAEATHGTAPKHAGKNEINPGSIILSACLMLEHMGWGEASSIIRSAVSKTVESKKVTYDIARQLTPPVEPISTTKFSDEIIKNL
ncbi:MAG: NADP-dependent isocitrate dehydrogenase [Candidatus Thorarchaeota archaeon]|nr:MAG: NADP-dependent isocitrate dehydrogenase [Candidatus Thorarchaeota archaeon]